MSKSWKISINNKWWTVGSVFFVVLILLGALGLGLQATYAERILPGTTISSLELSGLTASQARAKMQQQWEAISGSGFEFQLSQVTAQLGQDMGGQIKNERVTVFPFISAPGDPDQAYQLVDWDMEADLARVYALGHRGPWPQRVAEVFISLLSQRELRPTLVINELALRDVLEQTFGHREAPAQSASFSYRGDKIVVEPAREGQLIDYGAGIDELRASLSQLKRQPIELEIIRDLPTMTGADAQFLVVEVADVLARAPFEVRVVLEDQGRQFSRRWSINKADLQDWLVPVEINRQVQLGFNATTTAWLEENATEINQTPSDAKFEIAEAGKIAQFQESQMGRELDIDGSLETMRHELIVKKQDTAELIVQLIAPQVLTADANDLGISEIIGSGKSDFSGSPKNRRHNIQVSSDKLNGLLIPPGEEFSLVESLRPFTAEAGYVPELVIKGNRLIPEIGGGACQIGTTTFRAALNAGLDITQRRNHSFAVRYYNDEHGLPGTDATIYDPAPDFRFANNTPHHILIQTRIEGDILIYDFWGTSDGRQASTTVPVILAKRAAPETKYIETTDLEPGVTECSGTNVPGYTTSFTYTVATPEGEIEQEDFDSVYRPWQRVCLVGISPP